MLHTIRILLRRDDGMTTAEYAVGTVAACGFGGLLLQLLTSDSVMSLLRAGWEPSSMPKT